MYNLTPFRFWCQKVLPLVYDDSLSYVELLYKVVDYLNNTMSDVNELSKLFNELVKYVDEHINLDMEQYVEEKLNEMVEDGTLNDIIANSLGVSTDLMPFVKGSVVLDYQYAPSAYGRYGDTLYILSFNRGVVGSTSENGKVTEVNLTTNQIVGSRNAYLCHANSCCSVPNRNCHYVALGWYYDTDNSTHITAYGLAKYNNNFTEYSIVGNDYHFTGVSYDRDTDKVYGWDRPTGRIFEIKNDDSVELIGYVNSPNVEKYNQGFCVKNGYGYISGATGIYFKFSLETMQILYYGNVLLIDGSRNYELHELEDWEFNANNELCCIMYSKIRNVNSFALYSQISIPEARVKMASSMLASPAFTAIIDNGSVSRFDTNESYFKHPNEVYISTHKFNTISITVDTNFGEVVLGSDCIFNRSLVCDALQVRCSNVSFDPVYNTEAINIGVINIANRGARITFGGVKGIVYRISNINIGNSRSVIVFGKGTVWDTTEYAKFTITSPVVNTFVVCDDTLIGPNFTRGFDDLSVEIGAGETVMFTREIQMPFSSETTNWRFFVEYTPSSTPLIQSVSHSQNGNVLTANCYLTNPSDSNVTLTRIRFNIFNEATFTI